VNVSVLQSPTLPPPVATKAIVSAGDRNIFAVWYDVSLAIS